MAIHRKGIVQWLPYLRWIIANQNGSICVVLAKFSTVAFHSAIRHVKVKQGSSKKTKNTHANSETRDSIVRDFPELVSLNKNHFCELREDQIVYRHLWCTSINLRCIPERHQDDTLLKV
jgi:hypothetical protein